MKSQYSYQGTVGTYTMVLGLLVLMVCISCQGNTYSPKSYLAHVENHADDYMVTRDFDQITFQLAYQPPGYLASKQVLSGVEDTTDFTDLLDSYRQSSHYTLRLENTAGNPVVRGMVGNIEDYQELVQYLAFDIKEDVWLFTNRDTLPCQFAHFERNYDLAPFAQVQLGFALPHESILEPNEVEEWIVEFDAHRMGLGPIKFRFQNSVDINHPNIIF